MRIIYKTKGFPILQNRVYKTREEAVNCSKGDINIVINENGYIYNSDFDPSKMDYDQEYDNTVPSSYFTLYYSRIIDYLVDKYKLDTDSFILDIGCGKGTFLKQMFSEGKYSGRAIGIDPSYEGELNPIQNKLRFIKEYFSEEQLSEVDNVTLILLRHTLEHIPNPSLFLKNIFNVIQKCNFKNVPIFIEVPDVQWIFENKAYWDFFYEHVNYFSKKSLIDTISAAGAIVTFVKNDFGNQYLLAEAIVNSYNYLKDSTIYQDHSFDFSLDFNREVLNNIKKLEGSIDTQSKLVIWGMASKGIIYSLHLIQYNHFPNYFVDININKQDKYLPIIGEKIISPENLPENEKLSIVCMNPNYSNEIYEHCQKLKLDFNLFTPDFNLIIK
jgi:SAM-dependent methyltransferase